MSTASGVFLHTAWRSGGTWLWSRLRALDGVQAYYEPLHEHLATLSPENLTRYSAESWPSGHAQTPPYYLEYAALLKLRIIGEARGVDHYQARFAVENFFLDETARDDELARYIRSLLDAASYVEKLPLLKFCRSLGRVAWMRGQFPTALHAVLVRDPASQWQSSRTQYELAGNRYFLIGPCLVLTRNQHHEAVRKAVADFGIALPSLPATNRRLDQELCWRHLNRLDWVTRQRIFMAWWMATTIAALASDNTLLIDMERLAGSAEYRRSREQAFSRAGLDVSLTSANPPSQPAEPLHPAIIRAACAYLEQAGLALSDEAHGTIDSKLGNTRGGMPSATASRTRLVSGWHGVAPSPRVELGSIGKQLRNAAYFVIIAASMPLRRLHGRLRRNRAGTPIRALETQAAGKMPRQMT